MSFDNVNLREHFNALQALHLGITAVFMRFRMYLPVPAFHILWKQLLKESCADNS